MFVRELQKHLLTLETVSPEAKSFFALAISKDAQMHGHSQSAIGRNSGQNLFKRFEASIDIAKSGAIHVLQLDRATNLLPRDVSVETAVLFLAYQARLVLLPMSVHAIQEVERNHVYSLQSQRDLADFIFKNGALRKGKEDPARGIDGFTEASDNSDDDDEDEEEDFGNSAIISWKVVSGPKNLGKSTRVLSVCEAACQTADLLFEVSKMQEYKYSEDRFNSLGRIVGSTETREVVWLDLRGVISKASFISSVACQLALQEDSLADLEKTTEMFFLNLRPSSVIVLDHVSYPHGVLVLKEFFGFLSTYPTVDIMSSLTDTEKDSITGSFQKNISLVSTRWKISVVILTREAAHIESDLQTPWITSVDTRSYFSKSPNCQLQSVRCYYIPLTSREEALKLHDKMVNPLISSSVDVGMIVSVFGGVSGNLVQMLNLGDSAVSAARQFASLNESPFDIDAAIADIKIYSCIDSSQSVDEHLGPDCLSIVNSLLPLQITTLIALSQLESSEYFIDLFDCSYVAPPFHKKLAWGLCRDKFQSEGSNSSASMYPTRFETAWQRLCSVGWISPHQALGVDEMYYIQHSTRFPIFGARNESAAEPRSNYLSSVITEDDLVHVKSVVEKFLLLLARALVDLNQRLAYLSYVQAAELSSDSKYASYQYLKQKLVGYCYDSVALHLNILYWSAQLRFGPLKEGDSSSPEAEDKVTAWRNLLDPLSVLERYYKLSCIELEQTPLFEYCGVFPCRQRSEFSCDALRSYRSISVTILFSSITLVIAGNIDFLIRYRMPPVHAVSLCKISLESCVPKDPLLSMENSKIGKKLLVVERSAHSLKIPCLQYVSMLLEMSRIFVDRKRFAKAKELLRLATEISQELEESEKGDTAGPSSTMLVKSLLYYARCIEKASFDDAEGLDYDECEFDDDEAIFGIWTESVSYTSNTTANKSTKYYADGDCLRTVKYGHSKSKAPSVIEKKLLRRSEREKARPLYEQALFALEILNQVSGGLKDEAAYVYVQVLSRLGDLERALGNFDKAKRYVEDSVRWRKKYFGNYSPHVAEGFHQLGYLLQSMYKPEAAVQVYAIAVSIISAIQKEANFKLIAALTSVTACLRVLGREIDTKRYLKEICFLARSVFHSFDAPYISAIVRFACTLSSYEPKTFTIPGDCSIISSFGSRQFPLSLRPCDVVGVEYFCGSRLSKTINESNFSSSVNIIDMAISLVKYNIDAYKNRYLFEESGNLLIPKLMDVISRRKVESNEPVRLANILIVQASLQSLRGKYDESIISIDVALSAFKSQNTDPDTRTADMLLAKGEMNRRAAMANICGESLAHAQTLSRFDCKDFGNTYTEMDRLRRQKDALESFKDSLNIYRNIYGNDHPIVLSIFRYLASIYRDLGLFKTAKANFEIIMDAYHGIKVGPTVEYADALFSYAVMMRAAEDHSDSVTLLEQCLSIYRKMYGEISLPATITSFVLASSLVESEEMDAAETLLDDSLENFRKLYGDSLISTNITMVEPPVIGDILNYIASAKQVQLIV